MPVYMYDPPERFVAGSVGQPGERTFYLQATSQGRVTSVSLEKFQVSLLAERLDELLDEVLRRSGGSPEVPAATPAALQDDGPLDMPVEEEFRVGAIALAWDGDDNRVVIEAQEATEEPVEPLAEEVPVDGPAVLRVRITPGGGPGVCPASAGHRGRRAAALPAVRAAAERRRARVPTAERAPRQSCLTASHPAPAPPVRRPRPARAGPAEAGERGSGGSGNRASGNGGSGALTPKPTRPRGNCWPGHPGGAGPAGRSVQRDLVLRGQHR